MTRSAHCKSRIHAPAPPLFLLLLLLATLLPHLGEAAKDVTSTLPPTATTTSTTTAYKTKSNAKSSVQHVSFTSSKPQKSSSTLTNPPTSAIVQSTLPTSTCRFASFNYITNRLPQQCWTGSTSNQATSIASETPELPNSQSTQSTTSAQSEPSSVPSYATSQSSSDAQASDPTIHLDSSSTSGVGADDNISASIKPEPSLKSPAEPVDYDADSYLDNAEFLSFEEWKKKKQDAEQANQNSGDEHTQPLSTEDALDSLTEDGEILLDLSGFGGSNRPREPSKSVVASAGSQHTVELASAIAPEKAPTLSKDAGRTCKERTNYASLDCAASVLKTNPKCKSPSSILVENKDSYMLNECKVENKFLIVELCENIIIDTVVLANFEFFSSIFRSFRISVSDRYPVKIDKWRDLGTFEARNTRDIQPFLIKDCPIFAKYLRVEFLTHFGSEFYCPVSLLRVHGTTMYEDWRRIHQDKDEVDENEVAPVVTARESHQADQAEPSVATGGSPETKHESSLDSKDQTQEPAASPPSIGQLISSDASASSTDPTSVESSVSTTVKEEAAVTNQASHPSGSSSTANSTAKIDVSSTQGKHQGVSNITNSIPMTPTKEPSSVQTPVAQSNSSSVQTSATSNATNSAHTVSGIKSDGPVKSKITSTLTATPYQAQASSAPTPYQPPTQESFFKSIHKRLLFLETNSTLSLQYIESQSALLRDAFAKVEKRQLNKTSSFLESLNATVTAELSKFKSDYDRLWQSAVMELASQREESRKERELLGERVRMLAEEMGNQKRLMAAQATILLICLGLVVFGKIGSVPAAVDTGLLQGIQEIVAKAKEAKTQESPEIKKRWRWDSPFASPVRRSNSSPVVDQAPKNQRSSDNKIENTGLGIGPPREVHEPLAPGDFQQTGAHTAYFEPSTPKTALNNHKSAPTSPNG